MRTSQLVAIAALILMAAPGASAQQSAGETGFDVQLIGGMTAYLDSPHASAGALVRAHSGAWGLLGMGTYGAGGDYNSRLLGAGVSRRLVRVGAVDVSAFGGYGYYHERGWTEVERSATGLFFGGIASLDLDPIVLSIMLSDLAGRYDRDDVPEGFGFHVPRLHFGIGL